MRDVCAVVVSWNTKDLLRECLTALTVRVSAMLVPGSIVTTVPLVCVGTEPSEPAVEMVGDPADAAAASVVESV